MQLDVSTHLMLQAMFNIGQRSAICTSSKYILQCILHRSHTVLKKYHAFVVDVIGKIV